MANYYDQHMHTHFSFDSTETFENYLELTDGYLVTTEHIDLSNPGSNFQDDMPDYDQYSHEIAGLNQQYGNRILKGLEIGYLEERETDLRNYLQGKHYDLKLLSFHQNGQYDYMDKEILEREPLAVIDEYYELMLNGIKKFTDADVLAHFEYGVRLLDISSQVLKQEASSKLTEIFEIAIANDLAFELNSKSMYTFKKAPLYEYGIELYKSLGGTMFTIGSDAHTADKYQYKFAEAKKLLLKHGVNQLVTFNNEAIHYVDIVD